MINLVNPPPSQNQIVALLPKQLLTSYRDFLKAAALLDCQGQLLAFEGNISKNRLLVVAGRLIFSYQAFSSELGWSIPQLRAQSERGEFMILTAIDNNYLFVLTNPCLEGQAQSLVDSLENTYRGKNERQFFQEVEKQFCELVGPMGKVIIQKHIKSNRDSTPEKLISSLLDILKKYQIHPQKIKEFQQLTFRLLS
jgi:hypothetical protein